MYEDDVKAQRVHMRKAGHAIGCFAVSFIMTLHVSYELLGKTPLVILIAYIVGGIVGWAGYRWYERAHDWIVLQAYRLRGRF